MSVMELSCKQCDAVITTEDRNETTMIAICPECGEIFDFSDVVRQWQAAELRQHPPEHFSLHEGDGLLEISYAWFSWRAPLFLVLGIFVISAPVALLNLVGGEDHSINPLFGPPLLLIFLFGLWLGYYSLALFVNQTRIRITAQAVSITHAPVPLRKNHEHKMTTLKRVLHEQTIFGDQFSQAQVYSVRAITHQGEKVTLLGEFRTEAEAAFIAQQIASYHSITPPDRLLTGGAVLLE